MQHLGVKFGGILRFELGFCICYFVFFIKKFWLIFKTPVEKYTILQIEQNTNTSNSKCYLIQI